MCVVAPEAPGAPAIVDSDVNYIKLQWTAPQTDGGAAVTGYYVERRDKSTGVWIRLNHDLLPVSAAGLAWSCDADGPSERNTVLHWEVPGCRKGLG